jgi:hypothetical protein
VIAADDKSNRETLIEGPDFFPRRSADDTKLSDEKLKARRLI